MPFKKGNTEAKKKGKHEKTKQWEELGEAIVTTHAERFNAILDDSDTDTFLRNYLTILEYFKPKQARNDVTAHVEVVSKELPPFMKSNDSES